MAIFQDKWTRGSCLTILGAGIGVIVPILYLVIEIIKRSME